MKTVGHISLRLASATLALMALSSCLEHADVLPTEAAAPASSSAPQSLAAIGLRGAVYARDSIPAPRVLAPDDLVPAWGPDDDVATASITESLTRQGQITVEVGFAPGDGQMALQSALREALEARAATGARLDMKVLGNISISTSETHETEVTLKWQVTRADGSLVGEITQRAATSPERVATRWGDFATGAAAPAADAILALSGA